MKNLLYIFLIVFFAACNSSKDEKLSNKSDSSVVKSEDTINNEDISANIVNEQSNTVVIKEDTAVTEFDTKEYFYTNFEREVVKIGPRYKYKSLGEFFSEHGDISDLDIVVEEGIYFDKEIYVNGENIIIQAAGKVSLYCTELYNCVMTITGKDILVKGFHMTHLQPGTGENQNCSGRVIMFDNAEKVIIEQCDLNGCGLAGLHDNLGNSDIFIKNCYIHNNSLGAYTDINGGVWQYEIDDHPCFKFENNKIENNGPDRTVEPSQLSDSYPHENKTMDLSYFGNDIESWKKLPNPLKVKFYEIYYGDYFHLIFYDDNGVCYDFGFGDNNFGNHKIYYDTESGLKENTAYLGRKFNLFWELKNTTYPCCNGEFNETVGIQPSIVKLELITD